MNVRFCLFLFVLIVTVGTLPSSIALAQTPQPPPTPTPTPNPPGQSQIGEMISRFWPSALAAIFVVLAGFLGVQRLQTLENEIRITRQERDQLRQEVKMDLRDTLERSLKMQEDRLGLLQERINAQFAQVIESQQRTIASQSVQLKEDIAEVAQRAASLLGEIDERRRLFEQETAWLRKGVLRKPRNVKDAHDLATTATTAGRRNEAIQILESIVDPASNLQGTSDDYFNSAVQAASCGDLVLARRIGAKGLESYADDINLLTDYADNCGKTGEITEATGLWERLSNDPKAKTSWRYWIFYSDFLEKQGQLAQSLQLLEEAKKHLPNPTMAYREQGEAMEDQGKYDEAVQLYEEALRLDPSEDIARLKLAQLLYKLGKLSEALEHVNWAIRYVLPRHSRYFTAHYLKGQILLAMGKVDEARRVLRVAALNDEDAQVLLYAMKVEEGSIESTEDQSRPTSAPT